MHFVLSSSSLNFVMLLTVIWSWARALMSKTTTCAKISVILHRRIKQWIYLIYQYETKLQNVFPVLHNFPLCFQLQNTHRVVILLERRFIFSWEKICFRLNVVETLTSYVHWLRHFEHERYLSLLKTFKQFLAINI